MVLQIFAKIMTMSMNFMVARFVQKDIYGYSNIQFQLFYSMILFFSKEAVRRACQREVSMNAYEKPTIHRSALNLVRIQSIVNIVQVVICFPIQLFIAIATFVTVYVFYFQATLEYFTLSLFLICLSALIVRMRNTETVLGKPM